MEKRTKIKQVLALSRAVTKWSGVEVGRGKGSA